MAFTPDNFDLGNVWDNLQPNDRTKYQNLAFGTLRAYGINTAEDLDTSSKEAAFAIYLRQIVDGQGSPDSFIIPDDVKIAFDPSLIERPGDSGSSGSGGRSYSRVGQLTFGDSGTTPGTPGSGGGTPNPNTNPNPGTNVNLPGWVTDESQDVPIEKIPPAIARRSQIFGWAQQGDPGTPIEQIPANKLDNVPTQITQWNRQRVYQLDELVLYQSSIFVSLISGNLRNDPGVGNSSAWRNTGVNVTNSHIEDLARGQVYDWAEAGNGDQIPANKLRNAPGNAGGSGDDAYDWATEGNTDQIPANKLQNAPGGSGSGDDAYDWATVGNTDPIPSNKLVNSSRAAIYDWAIRNDTSRIPINKLDESVLTQQTLRDRSRPLGNFYPFADEATEFFSNTYTHQNIRSAEFHLADGVHNFGSFWGDNTAYSPTNTDGLIRTGNITFDPSTEIFGGLTDPTFNSADPAHGTYIAARMRQTGIQTNVSYTMLGTAPANNLNLLIPVLRINNGRFQYNQAGTRANQNWQNISGINSAGQLVDSITFQAGSTVEIVAIFQEKTRGNTVLGKEFIVACRQIGGSNPSTYQCNNFTVQIILGTTHLKGRAAGAGNRFEVWNDNYIPHEIEAELEDDHIDERGLGKVGITHNSTTHDTITGNVNIVGSLSVNGSSITSGKAGGGFTELESTTISLSLRNGDYVNNSLFTGLKIEDDKFYILRILDRSHRSFRAEVTFFGSEINVNAASTGNPAEIYFGGWARTRPVPCNISLTSTGAMRLTVYRELDSSVTNTRFTNSFGTTDVTLFVGS